MKNLSNTKCLSLSFLKTYILDVFGFSFRHGFFSGVNVNLGMNPPGLFPPHLREFSAPGRSREKASADGLV